MSVDMGLFKNITKAQLDWFNGLSSGLDTSSVECDGCSEVFPWSDKDFDADAWVKKHFEHRKIKDYERP